MTSVSEGVFFGRFPAHDEYQKLEDENINHIINLATEQQLRKSHQLETRFSFLDQSIPSPELLHEAVAIIEKRKGEGVYIHCALGLSRSVLLISAWLLYNKHTLDEVDNIISTIRPLYVKSAYMRVTLDIYQEYLANRI